MDFMNCPRCGRLFGRINSPICKECEREEEQLFTKVRQYIEEHPNAKVADVTEALDISVRKIMRYLREGRLEVSAGISTMLRCEKCNSPIKKGHYCDACVIELNQVATELFEKKEEGCRGARMHTFQGIQQIRHQRTAK